MADRKEYAAMIVAGQMAVRIHEATPRDSDNDNDKRKPEEIQAELLTLYQLCYDAILAVHDQAPLTATLAIGNPIPKRRKAAASK